MIERQGNRYRVTVPLLIANARALLEAGRGLLRTESEASVSVDLAAVTEVDSSALAVLFGLQRSAAGRGLSFCVLNPPAPLLSLAGMYGVSDCLPLA